MTKRILSLIVLACLVPLGAKRQYVSAGFTHSSGGGTPTHIQTCGNQIAPGGPSISCTWSVGAVTAGHFIYACVANGVYSISSPVWSGDSGTFTSDITNVSGGGNQTSCWYVPTAGGGGTTLTLTASGYYYPTITADEFSNVGALDQSDAGATGTSNAPVSNSITTTHNGDLILGYTTNSSGCPVPGPGTGFTHGATFSTSANEYLIQSTAGAIASTATLCTSVPWFQHVVAFQP